MHCFESDEDDLAYLTSLMSDDENDTAREDTSLQCNAKVEKPKSRTESKAFDEELDTVANSRKRRPSQQTGICKKKREEQMQSTANDNQTALLEGKWSSTYLRISYKQITFVAELKAMKEKMLKMEQLLEEKTGAQQIKKGNLKCIWTQTSSRG